MGFGDELVAAGQAQRLFEEFGQRVLILDTNHRPRWHAIWEGNPVIVNPMDQLDGQAYQRLVSAPNARPYIVYPFTQETGWTFNKAFHCRDYKARLYLTEEELSKGREARERYGPYVLIEPFTKHENFRWPIERWSTLVSSCKELTFVQHTHLESEFVDGASLESATFREACGLIASASAYVRSESGLCHAAAAIGIPQVTLFGGCMDAEVMGGYDKQICIVDEDALTPCGRWHRCEHCLKAMDRITVSQVRDALYQALGETVH